MENDLKRLFALCNPCDAQVFTGTGKDEVSFDTKVVWADKLFYVAAANDHLELVDMLLSHTWIRTASTDTHDRCSLLAIGYDTGNCFL
jgi:hypothetical protein